MVGLRNPAEGKMKKLAILFGGLLVLLLIVFIGLPGLLGRQVDKRLFEIVDQEIFAQYVDLELIDFEPGWFRSKARLSAKTGGPWLPLQDCARTASSR